jgi:hypothetical protein
VWFCWGLKGNRTALGARGHPGTHLSISGGIVEPARASGKIEKLAREVNNRPARMRVQWVQLLLLDLWSARC